jgi:hypothetical protein
MQSISTPEAEPSFTRWLFHKGAATRLGPAIGSE